MIELGKIPTFTGKLEELEKHAAALKKTASSIRTTGRDVHTAFQALDPVYDAPEDKQLLDSTIPVRDKADDFAKKLESVGGTLQSFASTAKPLVDKMNQLRADAKQFVEDNKGDDDWQKDQDKIDENARLVREVGMTWVAFQDVERDAANKITALVGSKLHFVVDDGSHKPGMYGFRESDVKDAKKTPWGTVDKREHTGLRAAWEWTKDNVGGGLKGFFVDGAWGSVKGLVGMVNVFDQDTFKETWKGIGSVFGGVSAYVMTPYDWVMDKTFGPTDHSDADKQKAALHRFAKSFIAWDQWEKNPSRAVGNVAFNVLTLGAGSFLKVGKAGQAGEAGKLGVGAQAATVMGKAGVILDPMTYVIKAGSVTKLKVGDLMAGLKASQAGLDDMARNVPTGNSPHPGEANAPSAHTGETPAGREYTDPEGNKRVIGNDGFIRDEHGNVVPDTAPHPEPHKDDLPNVKEHETVPVKDESKVLEGAGGPGRVENSANHPPGSAHPGGGATPNTPSTGGHAAGHSTGGGSGSHTPSGGSGSHTPPGSGGHGSGSGGGHQPGHTGHSASGSGHGTHGSTGSSGHGSGPHDPTGHGSGHGGDSHSPDHGSHGHGGSSDHSPHGQTPGAGGHDHDADAHDAPSHPDAEPTDEIGRETAKQAPAQHGVWQARDDIPGPASGKELRRPNPRHVVSGTPGRQVRPDNSIILPEYSSAVDNDIAAIAEGRAKLNKEGNRYEINGRSYGIEPNGSVYPDSGTGIVKLDRNEYSALQLIVKAKGDITAQPQLTRAPRFVNNPEAVQKAMDIYNGTYT